MVVLITGDRKWRHTGKLVDTLKYITDDYTKKNMIFIEGGADGFEEED